MSSKHENAMQDYNNNFQADVAEQRQQVALNLIDEVQMLKKQRDALLDACKEGLHECERVKMHCTCKHKDVGGLIRRIERIEAAIAQAEKEG